MTVIEIDARQYARMESAGLLAIEDTGRDNLLEFDLPKKGVLGDERSLKVRISVSSDILTL